MFDKQIMIPYADTDRDSGVEAFRFTDESIVVKFKTGSTQFYEYTNASAGSSNVEHMKVLAETGDGLNSFINTTVRNSYSDKW